MLSFANNLSHLNFRETSNISKISAGVNYQKLQTFNNRKHTQNTHTWKFYKPLHANITPIHFNQCRLLGHGEVFSVSSKVTI